MELLRESHTSKLTINFFTIPKKELLENIQNGSPCDADTLKHEINVSFKTAYERLKSAQAAASTPWSPQLSSRIAYIASNNFNDYHKLGTILQKAVTEQGEGVLQRTIDGTRLLYEAVCQHAGMELKTMNSIEEMESAITKSLLTIEKSNSDFKDTCSQIQACFFQGKITDRANNPKALSLMDKCLETLRTMVQDNPNLAEWVGELGTTEDRTPALQNKNLASFFTQVTDIIRSSHYVINQDNFQSIFKDNVAKKIATARIEHEIEQNILPQCNRHELPEFSDTEVKALSIQAEDRVRKLLPDLLSTLSNPSLSPETQNATLKEALPKIKAIVQQQINVQAAIEASKKQIQDTIKAQCNLTDAEVASMSLRTATNHFSYISDDMQKIHNECENDPCSYEDFMKAFKSRVDKFVNTKVALLQNVEKLRGELSSKVFDDLRKMAISDHDYTNPDMINRAYQLATGANTSVLQNLTQGKLDQNAKDAFLFLALQINRGKTKTELAYEPYQRSLFTRNIISIMVDKHPELLSLVKDIPQEDLNAFDDYCKVQATEVDTTSKEPDVHDEQPEQPDQDTTKMMTATQIQYGSFIDASYMLMSFNGMANEGNV